MLVATRWSHTAGKRHSSHLTLEVLRQTVRLLVVRRRNRCWDDVPREVCGEHLTIRSPVVSSTLPRGSAQCRPGTGGRNAVRW